MRQKPNIPAAETRPTKLKPNRREGKGALTNSSSESCEVVDPEVDPLASELEREEDGAGEDE